MVKTVIKNPINTPNTANILELSSLKFNLNPPKKKIKITVIKNANKKGYKISKIALPVYFIGDILHPKRVFV
jgi:hypothetical protein